jgi:hypothetical protein
MKSPGKSIQFGFGTAVDEARYWVVQNYTGQGDHGFYGWFLVLPGCVPRWRSGDLYRHV